jgi:SAM-dependent methyltransferase
MFQYIHQQQANKTDAYLWYLESGLLMQRIIEIIAARKWSSLQRTGNVLDFASGYGRLTRFLARAMPPERVWASDVKAEAVRFVRHQFGVNGFVSSSLPARLPVDERFDLIFVASLFSHLPDTTFSVWLQHLVDLLSPEGVIAFSVHDVALTGDATVPLSQQIPVNRFTRASEEVVFRSENEPLDLDTYGTSIVNEAYVAKVIEMLRIESKRYTRYPGALHGIQDLYLISRDPTVNFTELHLPSFSPSLAHSTR